MKTAKRIALASSCAFSMWALTGQAMAVTGQEVLENTCAACHVASEDGTYDRINDVRKSPEGWEMTLSRMAHNHGVVLTDEEHIAVVRYLSDTQGLTYAESEPYRYIFERDPVATDDGPDVLMTETCARCHSYARVGLQRRNADDWMHLLHFHLGQFPTLENQALARDRDWWGIAHDQIHTYLSETYPLGEAPAPLTRDISGAYRLAAHQPGLGEVLGTLTLEKDGDDYKVAMRLESGITNEYTGTGRVMGAGEWRASVTDGKTEIRQVFYIHEDGAITGRWFDRATDVIGARMAAMPEDAGPAILSLGQPRIKLGEASEIHVAGTGLDQTAELTLPEGISGEITGETDYGVTVTLTAEGDAREFEIGLNGQSAKLVAYDTPDRVTVSPELTLARIGGGGGPIPKVPAQFEALGWLDGPDGQAGTEDDIALGVFDAKWSIDNFSAEAAEMRDTEYAGGIDQNGLFTPADAGPNPERKRMTNNLGNLKVIAEVEDGGKTLTGEAQLYSTVQRFVDAPIR